MTQSKKPDDTNADSGKRPWRQVKVGELPGIISKEMSLDKLEKRLKSRQGIKDIKKILLNYHRQHVQTGSIRPLNHLLISVGLLSYAIGWPTELRHLRREEAKALGIDSENDCHC